MDKEQENQKIWDEVAAERNSETTSPVATPDKVITPEPEAPAQVAEKPVEPAKPTTEELLAQALARVEKLEGRTRNVEGHIGGLNHQQKTLQETFNAAQVAAQEVKDAPSQAQVKAAIANPEQWEDLKKDFPEWSEATEKYMDSKLAGIKAGADVETVNRMVADAVDSATQKITKEVEAKIVDKSLQAVFPGWKNDVNSDVFGKWLEGQTPDVQQLKFSSEVEDAARMLSLFRDAQKSNPAQQILNQRKQKLEAAVAAPRGTRPAPTKTPEQMSPEELWNHEAKLRERTRASA